MLGAAVLDRGWGLPRKESGHGRADPLRLPILFYAGTFLSATACSVDPRLSFWGSDHEHGTITYLALFVFYFLLRNEMKNHRDASRLASALLLGSVPVTLYGLAQFFGMDPLTWDTDSVSPALSTLGRSNFFGAYLAVVLPFASSRLRGDSRSWLAGTLVVFLLLGVLASQARAAWLGLVGGISIFAGSLAYRRRSRGLLLLTLVGLTAGTALFLVSSRVDLRSLTRPGAERPTFEPSFAEIRSGTIESRLDIWRTTIDLIPGRWLIGYGPATFSRVLHAQASKFGPNVIVDHPHNLVLHHWMSVGLAGLVVFFVIVWAFGLHTWKELQGTTRREDQALCAAALGSTAAFLVQAQFNPDPIVNWVLFWMVLAMASATWKPDPPLRRFET